MENEISEEVRQAIERLKAEYLKREAEGDIWPKVPENKNAKICCNCAYSSCLFKLKNSNRGLYYCALKDKAVEWDKRCREWKK